MSFDMKTALISGITGQTGAYLAHFLLAKGYRVVGGSRDIESANLSRLQSLKILDEVELCSLAPADFRSVLQVIRIHKPDEIYFLAGQTSVGLSFDQPFEAFESIAVGTLNFLEAIRILGLPCFFFNAGSTECFGNSLDQVINEESPMRPISPYAVAKVTSYWSTRNYRNSYGIHACTGLLSNHESPLRPLRFVTSKIVNSIQAIKAGKQSKLRLGNLSVSRDWGWAPDYAEAIYSICTSSKADDYIVATGKTHSLMEFITIMCDMAELDVNSIIEIDDRFKRPSDLSTMTLTAAKIEMELGWKSRTDFRSLVTKLFNGSFF
jgi:GDPmannose 4,6-dehydratase